MSQQWGFFMLTFNKQLLYEGCDRRNKYLHSLIQMSLVYSTGLNISSEIMQREYGRDYKDILDKYFNMVSNYQIGKKCRTYVLKQEVEVLDVSTKKERTDKKNASYIKFDDKILKEITKAYSHHEKICVNAHIQKIYGSANKEEMLYNNDLELGGRKTYAFACLPSEIRGLASIDGIRPISYDIKSSQPRTTVFLLGLNKMKQADAVRFTQLVCNGKIYDLLARDLGLSRSQAKVAYNASINSDLSTNTFALNEEEKIKMIHKSKVSEYIWEYFPTVYDAVKSYAKKYGKKSIGRHCMALEAKVIEETMNMHKDIHIIPVYDQIYVFADKETSEKVNKTFVSNIKKHMGWLSIEEDKITERHDHNSFFIEPKEQEQEEQGKQGTRETTGNHFSKAKRYDMAPYAILQKNIFKWFDFEPVPIRI